MRTFPLKAFCIDAGQYGLNIAADEYVDAGVRLLRTSDLSRARDDLAPVFVPGPLPDRYRVREGDLLLSRSGTVGVAHRVTGDEAGSAFAGFLVRFRPRPNVDSRWLGYCTQAQPFQEAVRADAVVSTISNFNAERYANIRLLSLGFEEQRRIADFLDDQVSRLDAAAGRIQAAASLAAEGVARRRRKRLTDTEKFPPDPSVHAIVPVRYLCKVTTGSGDTQDAVDGGGVPFYVRSDKPLSAQSATFNTEAILTSGDGAGVGKVFHHVKGRFHAHQRVYVLHTFQGILPRYFFHYFSTFFKDLALDGSAKSTVDSVRRDMITNMPVVLPPLEVQKLAADELDHLQSSARQVAATAERLSTLVKERKRALITACVTGEFDVSAASDRAGDAALTRLAPARDMLAE